MEDRLKALERRMASAERRLDELEAGHLKLVDYVQRAFVLLTELRGDLARIDENVKKTLELLQPKVTL